MPFYNMTLLEQSLVASVAILVGLFWTSVILDVWAWLHDKPDPWPDR